MLVVMEDRHIEPFAQLGFDFEAARSRDIFEIDAAEARRYRFHDFDDLIDIGFGDADRERFDAGEGLEENRLAFHDRQSGLRSDVPESEHGRAIGDDGDQVALGGQLVDLRWIVTDHPGRDERARRHAERVEHVVIANRNVAADFQHAAVALAEFERALLEGATQKTGADRRAPVLVDERSCFRGHRFRIHRYPGFARFIGGPDDRGGNCRRDPEVEDTRNDVIGVEFFRFTRSASASAA